MAQIYKWPEFQNRSILFIGKMGQFSTSAGRKMGHLEIGPFWSLGEKEREKIIGPCCSLLSWMHFTWPISVTAVLGHFKVFVVSLRNLWNWRFWVTFLVKWKYLYMKIYGWWLTKFCWVPAWVPACFQRRFGNFIQNRLVTRSMTKNRHPDEG